jgi:threonine dehydrogenase-like Zn-dependent dehydrogenase
MKATMLYGPPDIRFEDCPDPQILKPTDAIVRITAACVCGSDLWPYRGIQPIAEPMPMGHEHCGVVEEVGVNQNCAQQRYETIWMHARIAYMPPAVNCAKHLASR